MKKYIKVVVSIILICILVSAASSSAFAMPNTLKVASGGGTMGDIVSDAGGFINAGLDNNVINENALESGSSTIYNVLLTIGIAVALIWGMVLGAKFVTGSVEDKADIKSNIIPYIIGCVIIFGAFGIWKLLMTILEPISNL